MRRSRNSQWLKDENGQVVGLNLGADYCAEHEWGIKDLKKILGVNESDKIGIDARKISLLSEEHCLITDDDRKKTKTGKTVLIIEGKHSLAYLKEDFKKNLSMELKPLSPWREETHSPLSCAWDGKSLGVIASSPEDRQNLRELCSAMKEGDAAIWLGGGGVFENAGLVLAIISRISENNKTTMLEADQDRNRLNEADMATGIKERLKEANKSYYALSPRWKGNAENTAHPVIYWLNPQDQQNNNYGWYTVEQLEQWANNQGPIPKQK